MPDTTAGSSLGSWSRVCVRGSVRRHERAHVPRPHTNGPQVQRPTSVHTSLHRENGGTVSVGQPAHDSTVTKPHPLMSGRWGFACPPCATPPPIHNTQTPCECKPSRIPANEASSPLGHRSQRPNACPQVQTGGVPLPECHCESIPPEIGALQPAAGQTRGRLSKSREGPHDRQCLCESHGWSRQPLHGPGTNQNGMMKPQTEGGGGSTK